MDVRLSAYWLRQTKIKGLEEQLRMMDAARVAQAAEPRAYKQQRHSLMQQLSILNLYVTPRVVQDRNWDSMRATAPKKKRKK